ncbi:MAG: hypothetical protein R3F49_00730 [Planctomycetota bacterium]
MTYGSDVTPSAPRTSPWDLAVAPPPERWDDWTELDPKAWPVKSEKHYTCVPTICFNCESACGLLAYVDKATGQIDKFEGNPWSTPAAAAARAQKARRRSTRCRTPSGSCIR